MKKQKEIITEDGLQWEVLKHGVDGDKIHLPAQANEDLEGGPLARLRKDLEDSATEYLRTKNNPLDTETEIDFIDKQIKMYHEGIAKAEELQNKIYHSHQPHTVVKLDENKGKIFEKQSSIFRYEIANLKAMIKVAEEWKAELLKAKIKQEKKKNFRALPELFGSSELFDKCLNVLRELKVIDKLNKVIGNKGAFVIWIYEMDTKHLIAHTNEHEYACALSEYFKPFSISDAIFRQPHPRATKNYQSDIRIMLSEIKPS